MKMPPPQSPALAPGREGAFRTLVSGLAVDTLQWAVGLFCAFIGAFVLVAPHQFANLPSPRMLPLFPWWGLAALVWGAALLSVPVTRPRGTSTVLLHAAAGAVLALLGVSFVPSGGWVGFAFYSTLGLGTIAAGLLPGARRTLPHPRGDLFSLLMGIGGTLGGAVLLASPRLLDPQRYGESFALLPWFGAAWLATAPALAWVHLRPPRRRLLRRVVHLLAGTAFLSFGLAIALPRLAWTGLALYCGAGLLLVLLPWLRRWLARADPSALRTRLALALALATSVALILAVAVVAEQEERLAEAQLRSLQQAEADSVARNVADYLRYNSARSEAVAAAVAQIPAAEQTAFLESVRRVHPDLAALATLDRSGRELAHAGGLRLGPAAAAGLAESVRRQRVPVLVLRPDAGTARLLLLGTPLRVPAGRPQGILVTVVSPRSLLARIQRPESRVVLGAGGGRVVATLDGSGKASAGASSLPALPDGWERQVAAGVRPAVGSRLAAFAAVPDVGWAVAVERSREFALAGVRRGRDLAFVLLLAVVGIAVVAGIVTARRIARPLGTLADAVDQMTAGNPAAPLGASTVTEVERLSRAFAEMRDRLAARTAEAERLAAESRARAEELAETDRRKDEFLAMLAHELRNPMGAIANASYLLGAVGAGGPQGERAAAVIQRQSQHLVRLVDDLLDVSRITRGKVVLRREPLDLGELVRLAAEEARPLAEANRLALTIQPPGEALPVVADATRLDQVVTNLLRNAVKFTEPGGSIRVAASRQGEEAVVEVHDSGLGMAPELLPRIFDLFVQGEQALDRPGSGLGIGLTLVRRLVELHGGRVEAASEGPGRGAELTVRLPLATITGSTAGAGSAAGAERRAAAS